MVFQSLEPTPNLDGADRAEQYREMDRADRARILYESFMHADDDELYIGDEVGVKGLLVYLVGTYVSHRGDEIASTHISFSPPTKKITCTTDLVSISSDGSDAPTLDSVARLGLEILREEYGAEEGDPRFADLGSFCMAEDISIRSLPESLTSVPQIGAIEWLAAHRSPELAEVRKLPVAYVDGSDVVQAVAVGN